MATDKDFKVKNGIVTGGNAGIGVTPSGAYRLEVLGDIRNTSSLFIGTDASTPTAGYHISGTQAGGAIELRTNSATTDRGFRLGVRNNASLFTPILSYLENVGTVSITVPISAAGAITATSFSGAGTGLTGTAVGLTAGNSATAGGFTPSQARAVSNRIVVANSSGYIDVSYINATDEGIPGTAGTITGIIAKRGDDFYRNTNAASVAAFVGPSITSIGTIATINGQSPPNGAIRCTPNLHLNGSAGFAVICSWDNGNGGNSASPAFRVGNGAASDVFTVSYGGTVVAVGDITAFSDARVKTDIEVIPNALSKVEAIRGVTYTRIDEGQEGIRQTGIIAQELLTVLPEAVHENEDGMLSVAYGNTVGLLVEAIKELSAQNKALVARLEVLEAKE